MTESLKMLAYFLMLRFIGSHVKIGGEITALDGLANHRQK